jgi:hypothetical protein
MSVVQCIILVMTNELVSTKYTFACDPDECDCLIELTSSDGFGFPSGVMQITCPCGRKPTLLSVVTATIAPTTQTKEEQMETTTIGSDAFHSPAVEYNPDLLVTYKVIKGYSDPEYTTSKVASLEWDLHNGRQSQKTVGVLQDKINVAKDIIAEAYADSNDQDTLRSIAEALGIELTRTIEFTCSIEVSGTVEVDLLEDYELEDDIADNLYVDSQSGRIEIGDIEVCHVREA